MKYFLISDNVDTLAGMRLVGVHGVVVHEEDEVRAALEKACADEEIGLVLITDKLVAKCADTVFAYKLGRKRPLIVEMPDRHSDSNPGDSIRRYISEVVGAGRSCGGWASFWRDDGPEKAVDRWKILVYDTVYRCLDTCKPYFNST